MTTHIPVSINTNAANALNCAYNSLLSFESVEDTYAKESIYTVYGIVQQKILQHRFEANKKLDKFTQVFYMPCLITLKPITNSSCELFISVSISETGLTQGDFSGRANEFIGEFLKRFSEALEKLNS